MPSALLLRRALPWLLTGVAALTLQAQTDAAGLHSLQAASARHVQRLTVLGHLLQHEH